MSLNKSRFRDYLISEEYYRDKPYYKPYYNPYDEGIHRSWTRFQEQRPYLSQLLMVLFGEAASQFHLEAAPIPEDQAQLVMSFFKKYPVGRTRIDNLEPVGDS